MTNLTIDLADLRAALDNTKDETLIELILLLCLWIEKGNVTLSDDDGMLLNLEYQKRMICFQWEFTYIIEDGKINNIIYLHLCIYHNDNGTFENHFLNHKIFNHCLAEIKIIEKLQKVIQKIDQANPKFVYDTNPQGIKHWMQQCLQEKKLKNEDYDINTT